MKPLVLLADLRSKGVQLELADDRIRWKAPAGIGTAEIRDQLVQHKAELIRILDSEAHDIRRQEESIDEHASDDRDIRDRCYELARRRGFPRFKHPSPCRPEHILPGGDGWALFCDCAALEDVVEVERALGGQPEMDRETVSPGA